MPQLSIVVPVCNEADNILPLTREVIAALHESWPDFELVFVDDGSTDSTWAQIAQAHQLDERVRGLRHLGNFGQSAALWSGFRATGSPLLATLDGDLQNDPADLPKLLREIDQCDFVTGVRQRRQDKWLRRASSQIARKARKSILGVDFCDTGCGLRVFRRTALEGVFPFNGLHRFLPILAQGAGRKIREIPVGHRPRVSGCSKYGIWNRLGRGIIDLLAMRWYQRRRIDGVPFEELERQTNAASSRRDPVTYSRS